MCHTFELKNAPQANIYIKNTNFHKKYAIFAENIVHLVKTAKASLAVFSLDLHYLSAIMDNKI